MIENAARARRWMLWAAPATALSGLFFGVGGAAAGLALWMGLGLLLSGEKGRIRLYPKQRRIQFRQLFLGYSFSIFCFSALRAVGSRLLGGSQFSFPSFLILLGSIGFGLPAGAWAIRLRIRKWLSRFLTVFFFVLFFLLLRGSNLPVRTGVP